MTYAISDDGESIQCLECGLISYNPNDIANRYCGSCHEFHDDREYMRVQTERADRILKRVAEMSDEEVNQAFAKLSR